MMLTQQSAFRVKCGWLLRGVWWPWQDTILALTLCFEGGRSYPVYLVLMSQLQSWILKYEITFQKIKKKKKLQSAFLLSPVVIGLIVLVVKAV